MKAKALIITGFGLNCENETKAAFDYCGAEVSLVHLNDILNNKVSINSYHFLSFIGGFSFGDHIGAGTVFANRIKYSLTEELINFINSGKLIIGICNGFQTLTRLGILPDFKGFKLPKQSIALDWNDSGVFRDDWVNIKIEEKCPCVFTKDIKTLEVPIRHGEGKFVANEETINFIEDNNLVAMRYADKNFLPTAEFPANPNGSINNIAGICNTTGRIFGLMPHPEAFLSPYNHPDWIRQKELDKLPKEGQGVQIFRNAVKFIEDNL
jgi:phosphoribosylformylglycinamidine synthase subunit PurQ / glutaminase